MIDLVTTNGSKSLKNICCVQCDLSDLYQMVCFAAKLKPPVKMTRHVLYRSNRKSEENVYVHDISNIPYHVREIFDDVDDAYWFYETLMKHVIDEDDPLNKKIV